MIFDFCDEYTMTVMTLNIRYLMDMKMNYGYENECNDGFHFFSFKIFCRCPLLKSIVKTQSLMTVTETETSTDHMRYLSQSGYFSVHNK
jgi:hypothetical protein